MLSQFKIYAFAASALVVIGLAGTLYVYKLKYEKAVVERADAIAQRDTMLAVNQQILDGIQKDAELKQKLYKDLEEARNAAETYKQKFAEHDLAKLAAAKPGLLTLRAQRATQRVLDSIEAAINREAQSVSGPASSSGQSASQATPAEGAGG